MIRNPKNLKKICLIVDNPARDLDGLILIAKYLAQNGCEVFLTPMYTAGYEIAALAPDYVLFNYARTANAALISSLYNTGIEIGILDTEGGIWESPLQFVKSIAHKELSAFISQYFTWGPLQQKALTQHTNLPESKIFVTGSPRHDFCIHPWKQSVRAYDESLKNYILVISNFSLAYPRFASTEVEIQNVVNAGYERAYAEARAADEHVAKQNLISLIAKAAAQYPEKIFVIRTHPFENEADYTHAFKDNRNIKIVRKGTVSTWLKNAKCAIHFNSSVSIDSALMGVPVYTLDWISSDIFRNICELTLKISIPLKSEDEFRKILSEDNLTYRIPEHVSSLLSDWFYLSDGLAHERVGNKIINLVTARKRETDLARCKKIFFYGGLSKPHYKGYVDSLGRLTLGSRIYGWIRNNLLTKNFFKRTKSDKIFTLEQVEKILSSLNKIQKSEVKAYPVDKSRNLIGKTGLVESICICQEDEK